MPTTYHLPHLRTLEAEAVHPLREVAAEFERPVLLFSGGSFREEFGQWEPQRERPEVWSLYNGRIRKGEHARVFPISNWTELDVWQYIAEEALEVPSIYFAHGREVFARDGMLYAVSPFVALMHGEHPFNGPSATERSGI
jgi:3'-phosphoadenosine 5'-phosphosulfate sulfotransferase (PAPS reductase)/FAD synthetase